MSKFALSFVIGALFVTSSAMAAPLVQISVIATDLGGSPISSINVGEDFRLQAIVQDIRTPPAAFSGVFAAYLNVAYDDNLVSVPLGGQVNFAPQFGLARTSDLSTPGLVGTTGAGGANPVPAGTPQPLWSLVMHAEAIGLATFVPSPDMTFEHDVLLYLINDPIPFDQINYVGASLSVVPEPASIGLAATGLVAVGLIGRRRSVKPTSRTAAA